MSRFNQTYCSQCGGTFGPGDHGYSHCEDHSHPVRLSLEQAQEAGCFDADELQPTPAHTCMNAGTSAGACKTHCGDKVRCWGNT